ncbi:MAG TPA: DUF1697 domain-containing protein [Allosphingosinicella sp.]|nr:DUF1697 domain-containing protein [Allosphingosinicella sp.]
MPKSVALLRGINVSASNKILMTDLRELCAGLGWRCAQTYIQSGNIVFEAEEEEAALEWDLEQAIRQRLALEIPVVVRSSDQWTRYVAANPFPDAAETEPDRLMLYLSKSQPAATAERLIQERARDGERIALAAGALWIHYPAGAGRSRLSPTLIDRLIGSSSTARNWRTVMKLQEMLDASGSGAPLRDAG